MAGAGTVYIEVRGDTTGFLGDIRNAAEQAGGSFTKMGGAQGVLSAITRTAGVAAVGVGFLGVQAVQASTAFNKALSGVNAVANATSGQMDQLRKAALDAGAATVFTASQSAQAEAELAKAGLSVADILGGGLTGALSLASAGQLDLGTAATITAQALNTFGLSGAQTGHVADVLAAGANKSAADVGQLGQALQQSGLVAKQAGLSIEDTVGVLSLFAQNGLQASDAGTSLRTMLLRLTPVSGQAKDAMTALGLNFFDSQNKFIGIAAVAQQLQDKMKGLTQEQRQTAFATIFGSDAIRAATLLYDSGAKGVNEYTTAVNDSGAAQRNAAKQLDNLSGDVEQFKGSLENVFIALGDSADSGLRGLVQAGTSMVNELGALAQSPVFNAIGKNIGETIGSIASSLGSIGRDITSAFSSISTSDVDKFFTDIRGAVSGLEGPLAGVAASLSLIAVKKLPFVGPALAGFLPALSPITGALAGVVLQSADARKALGGIFSDVAGAATAIAPVLLGVADVLGTLASQAWLVVPALDAFIAFKIVETVSPWIGSLKTLGETAAYAFSQVGSVAATQGVSKLSALGGILKSTAGEAGGLSGALGAAGLSAATLGATAAIAGGLYIYSSWRQNLADTETRVQSLTDALNKQADASAFSVISQKINSFLQAPKNAGLADTLNAAGVSVKQLSTIINSSTGDFSQLVDKFDLARGNAQLDYLRSRLDTLPASIRPFIENLFRMEDAGQLSSTEIGTLLRGLGELDQGARRYAGGVEFQAKQFAAAAKGADLSAEAQKRLAAALNDNASLDARRAALDYLISSYPALAQAAGIVSDATNGTAGDTANLTAGIQRLTTVFGLVGGAASTGAAAISVVGDAARQSLGEIIGLFGAQSGLVDANQKVTDAQKKLADIESGNTEGLISARAGLKDAQEALTKALEADANRLVDAQRRLADANDKLAEARDKGAAQATGGKAGDFPKLDLSVARDIASAQRDVADAQKAVDEASRPSDQTVSAKARVTDAQKKYNDELAKTGPASREYRDAQREVEAAERDRITSALGVADAMTKVTADDIPAAITALQQLRDQHLLTDDAVNQVTGSLLREAAAIAAVGGGSSVPVPPAAPSPRPVTTLGPTARPGAVNADRENRGATASGGVLSKFQQLVTGATGVVPAAQRDLATFIRQFPTNPTPSEAFSIGGRSFVWNGTDWIGGDKQAAFDTWKVRGYRFGGLTPGFGTEDKIKALLAPKEYVSTADTVARETPAAFHALNAGRATITPLGNGDVVAAIEKQNVLLQGLQTAVLAAAHGRANIAIDKIITLQADKQSGYQESLRRAEEMTYGGAH